MGLTIKTIVKIFLLFFCFQIGLSIFAETIPEILNLSTENELYLATIINLLDSKLTLSESETIGTTLLTDFYNSISTLDYFNTGIINAFLGVLVVIGTIIEFLINLMINILFTPGIIVNILLYNFIFSNSYLFLMQLVVNISFYGTLFYIVFKRRISSN